MFYVWASLTALIFVWGTWWLSKRGEIALSIFSGLLAALTLFLMALQAGR